MALPQTYKEYETELDRAYWSGWTQRAGDDVISAGIQSAEEYKNHPDTDPQRFLFYLDNCDGSVDFLAEKLQGLPSELMELRTQQFKIAREEIARIRAEIQAASRQFRAKRDAELGCKKA